jgi:iron-sulfur cluster repair protein YtfE (RIC family)
MWDNITSSDIEQAKHHLNLRRAETVSRHAEEIKVLDADHAELDQLVHVIEAFTSKHQNANGAITSKGENPAEVYDRGSATFHI